PRPIGNVILLSAYRALHGRRFRRAPPALDEPIRWMTMLSRDAAKIMVDIGVSAATDITGYGLVGHLLEVCVASRVGADIHASAVPVLDGAREWLARGYLPAGTKRNAESFKRKVTSQVDDLEFTLLC